MNEKDKINVINAVINPGEVKFVEIEVGGHKLILDLREIKEITEDMEERILQLIKNIPHAPTVKVACDMSDHIRDRTRRAAEYILNRRN